MQISLCRCLRLARWFTSVLLLLFLRSACATASFDVSTIAVGPQVDGGVLAARLYGPRHADLIIREVTDKGSRGLALYSLDETGKVAPNPVKNLTVSEDVIFVDTGRITANGRDSLVLFRRDGATLIDPATGHEEPFLSFSSLYKLPLQNRLPSLDLIRDINGDGLDDVLIPDFDGYHLFLQVEEGRFGAGILIEMPATMDVGYQDFPWYRPANPYVADMNLDGLADLVFLDSSLADTLKQGSLNQDKLNQDMQRLNVFFQKSGHQYTTTPQTQMLAIDVHEEGLAGLTIRLGEAKDQSDLETRSLYKLADLDQDGRVDLVTLTVKSEGVFNKSSRYEIHMGDVDESGVHHHRQADSVIESDGIQFGIDEKDFDNDGSIDFVVSSAEIGIGKILAALITGSFSSDLHFYRLQNGKYASQPNAHRAITATFDLSSGKVFYPTVLIADFDGDKRADLVVQDGRSGLNLYRGVDSKELFARRPVHFAVPMPGNPDMISVFDLNGDEKMDIVIRYEKDDDGLFGTVKALISR